MSIVVKPRAKKQTKFESISARNQLQELLYRGTGDSYLGYDLRSQKNITGRFSKIRRYRKIPEFTWNQKTLVQRLEPIKLHARGEIHGLVIDDLTIGVPFIAPDSDHHRFNAEDYEEHKAKCLKIAETISKTIKSCVVTAEINKENCSVKWFIYPKDRKSIPLEVAIKAGETLYKALLEQGIDIEIFPYNLKQIRLPLHPDKITIIDSGILEKKKIGRSLAYSNKGYLESLDRGASYCPYSFEANLDACSNNLIDGWSKPASKTLVLQDSQESEIPCESRLTAEPSNRVFSKLSHSEIEDIKQQPCAFTKDRLFCQFLFRKCGVITIPQFLELKEQYGVYNGEWKITDKRLNRAKQIVPFVKRGYKEQNGNTFNYEPENHKKFSDRVFPNAKSVIKRSYTMKRIDALKIEGVGDVGYNRYVKITPETFLMYFTLAEEIRKTSLLDDGGIPEKRLKEIMPCLGLKWNRNKWAACRDMLHNMKILHCDYIKIIGKKSYCYSIDKNHPDYVRDYSGETIGDYSTSTSSNDSYTHNTVSVYDTERIESLEILEPIPQLVGVNGKPPP